MEIVSMDYAREMVKATNFALGANRTSTMFLPNLVPESPNKILIVGAPHTNPIFLVSEKR